MTSHDRLFPQYRSDAVRSFVKLLPLTFFVLASCVPVDQLPPGSVPGVPASGLTSSASFGELEPGNTSVTTSHFVAKGYNEADLNTVTASAESIYAKIGNDTGLYTALAGGSYTIVLYKDQNEYTQKTHQPAWSQIVSARTTLYTFAGQQDIDAVLAHELSHVVFNNYLGDKATDFRWLNEGLAMVEEVSKMSASDRSAYQSTAMGLLRQNKQPFSQMTFFTTNSEEHRRTDAWYAQVYSVTTFLMGQGSALTFAAFMNELKTGANADQAIADNFPARFRSMNELETSWKSTIP